MLKRILLAICIAPTAAQAQETGTLIERAPAQASYQDKNAARVLTKGWARCVVQQSPKRVEAYLELPTGSSESRKMASRFLTGLSSCISGEVEQRELETPDTITRGAMYEALYLQRFGRTQPPTFGTAPTIIYGWAGNQNEVAQQVTALARFGDCVVRRDPVAARALLDTSPGSGAEGRLLGTLMPHLSMCLPKGKPFEFSKSLVRGALAEPLYKLTAAMGG